MQENNSKIGDRNGQGQDKAEEKGNAICVACTQGTCQRMIDACAEIEEDKFSSIQ